MKITPEVVFGRNQRQLDAWNTSSQKRFMLYGGAAGGGKSFFLRWWAVFYLLHLHLRCGTSKAPVMLACEDYPSLLDRQVSKIKAEFPPELGTLRQGVTLEYELRPEYGSGRILLRNLDDPSKYLSSEFAGIAVDELTRNDEDVFNFLRLRLRWPGVERPCFVAGTNPGGRGHGWVKKLWIDKDFPAELRPLAKEFAFVESRASDNPFLPASYYENLLTLPPAMAKAYAEGRWDLFVGQYFTNFGPRNCFRPESLELKPWHPRWISIDWGFEHPAAIYWHATPEADRHRTYREWVVNHTGPRELALGIAERSKGENIDAIYLSPDAFARKTDEDTIAEQMRKVLVSCGLPSPIPADDDRVGGWMLMYQLLDSGGWMVSEACPELIRGLPNLIRDDRKVEDVAKAPGDDAADAARYGLKTRLSAAREPAEVGVRREADKIADPVARWFYLRKHLEEARERHVTIEENVKPVWEIEYSQ